MEYKNLFTMKQPALGKKIIELRKLKGLTQEELVEKCNINVRTIQRIEAGETTPRSFTIKTILQALDSSIDVAVFTKEIVIDNQDKKALNTAWIFGIVYFVIGFVETIADFYQLTEVTSLFNGIFYISIKIISSITFVCFFSGFLRVAHIYSQAFLKIIVPIFMIAYVGSEVYDIFSMNSASDVLIISSVVKAIIFGTIQIIFGFTLVQLKPKLGRFVEITGILEIITGVCLATVILASLGLFLLIPTVIFEVILIYKLAKNKLD